MFSKNELIKSLQELSKIKNSKNISKKDVDENVNSYSSSTYKRHFGSWSNALKEAGLKTGIITGRPQSPFINLSSKALEIIEGELLGDGSLTSSRVNSSFEHSTANIDYGKYLYKLLQKEIVPLGKPEILVGRNGGNPQFRTRTICNKTFTELRGKWYPFGKKIIPEDIKLTSTECLHWFLGDGSGGSGLVLHTNCFSNKDIEILRNRLYNIGIKTSIHSRNRIYIFKNYADIFLKYIGECPVKGYNHKWNR